MESEVALLSAGVSNDRYIRERMKLMARERINDSEESNSSEGVDVIIQNLSNERKRRRLVVNDEQQTQLEQDTESEFSEQEYDTNTYRSEDNHNEGREEVLSLDAPSTSSHGQNIVNAQNEMQLMLEERRLIVQMLEGHSDLIQQVIRDANFILSASLDTTVKVWNSEGVEICSLRGHTGAVNGIVLIPSEISKQLAIGLKCPEAERIAVSGSQDSSLKIWMLPYGRQIKSIYVYNSVNCLCYLKESHVIIGTDSGKLQIWDILSSYIVISFQVYTDALVQLQVSGEYVTCLSLDGTLKIWHYIEHQLLEITQKMQFENQNMIWRFFGLNNDKLYVINEDSNIYLLDLKTDKIEELKKFADDVTQMSSMFAFDDRIFISKYDPESAVGYIDVYQLPECKYNCSLIGELSFVKCIYCVQLSDDHFCIITGGKECIIWNCLNTNQPNNRLEEETKFRIVCQKLDISEETNNDKLKVFKSYLSRTHSKLWIPTVCNIL